MIRLVAPAAILANSVAAGVMFSTVIGIVPLTLVLPYDRYVQAIQFLWPRYDPLMPITNGAAFLLDVTVTVLAADEPERILFGLAAALLAAVMSISMIKNVPINKYVTSLDPVRQPPDWAERDPRIRWRNWNLARTALALLALVVNVAGVGMLL
jgi:uncharacterized membrane protein